MQDEQMTRMYEQMGISETVYRFGRQMEEKLAERFASIDRTAEYNQMKVIRAMQENRVSEGCFHYTSGYGYDDLGRETLEKVYAGVFHTQSALVRPQIACGTHALSVALAANLRPGDELLSPAGKPYDTLEEVIGIRPSRGSLAEYGVTYRQVDLLEDGTFDYENIEKAINERTRMVTIQRSKGYQTRPSFSVAQIGELIAFVKKLRPDLICMVDNCYGEFVELTEPSDVGADMVAPSSRIRAADWRPSAGTLRAERSSSRTVPAALHLPALAGRWALLSASCSPSTRAFSLRPPWWPAP